MQINVIRADEEIMTLDVDPDDTVDTVKALLPLQLQEHELVYDGREMGDRDNLTQLGVQDGDFFIILSNSSSSPNHLDPSSDGSAVHPAAFQQDLQCDPTLSTQVSQTDLKEYALEVGADVSSPVLPVKDNTSYLPDEARRSKLESPGGNVHVNDEVKMQRNGTCTHVEENDHEHHHDPESSDRYANLSDSKHLDASDHLDANMVLAKHPKETDDKNPQPLDSSLSPTEAYPPIPPKGFGLKKWKRYRREGTRGSSPNTDSTKLLKRGSANISEVKQPDDSSASSTNALVNSPRRDDPFSFPKLSSNDGLAVDTTFSAGADNSEDRSSKSSTGASAPKSRNDVLRASGHHHREKHRVKNVSVKHVNSSGPKFQLGKSQAQADSSKKARGEGMILEKVNSLSSMESDSRSSSSVFLRGTSSVNSDQRQGERLTNYDEDAYDQPTGEAQSTEESHAGQSQNFDLSLECSAELSWSASKGKSKDYQLSSNCEPLVNSILMLQSAQEALEREVLLFKEIGKGICSLCDDSGKTTSVPVYSMFVGPEGHEDRASDGWDSEFNQAYMSKNVQKLEKQLKEAKVALKEKEMRVVELETTIKSMNLPREDERSSTRQYETCPEIGAELEGLFKQKVEAEVQYVAITKSTKDLSVLVGDQIKILREQKSLAREQAESVKMMDDVEKKAVMLQRQAKELDTLYTDMAKGEEIHKMQSRVVKLASCLSLQLMLLVLVFGLVLWDLFPKSSTVVPT